MLLLLSPSKTLNSDPQVRSRKFTTPEHLEQAEELIRLLRRLSRKQLQNLMGISENLAGQVEQFIQSWRTPFDTTNAKPALFVFKGDVYEGLDVDQFKARDLDFAQKHLRILSGLYGVLRPLDLMQPYRLEMGCQWANKTGKKSARFENLYQYWGSRIRTTLATALEGQRDQVIVNLASNEYFKSVQSNQLNACVITPVFKEAKNGKYQVFSFFAKKARGQLARFILLNRLKKPGDMQSFDEDGYAFNQEMSTSKELVFTRG